MCEPILGEKMKEKLQQGLEKSVCLSLASPRPRGKVSPALDCMHERITAKQETS